MRLLPGILHHSLELALLSAGNRARARVAVFDQGAVDGRDGHAEAVVGNIGEMPHGVKSRAGAVELVADRLGHRARQLVMKPEIRHGKGQRHIDRLLVQHAALAIAAGAARRRLDQVQREVDALEVVIEHDGLAQISRPPSAEAWIVITSATGPGRLTACADWTRYHFEGAS